MDESHIRAALEALGQFNPKSVFLYGSRGRNDFTPDSDYELGVIFDDEKYVQRSDIHAAITDPKVKAYPFKWRELQRGTFSHVFQRPLYVREIINGGQTVAGEHLLERITPPPITTLDLIQGIRFELGLALAAILSFRAGDTQTSMEEFSKSCLFGLRCLEILELKTFPLGYDEIYKLSSKVVTDPEYKEVVEVAHALRQTGKTASMDVLFTNISLLDTYIEPKILAAFNSAGNQNLI